jgi:exopolyphosphatase/guanosine-5'-triphosphate,3'-diphosphate pyrophosphatase
MAVTRAVIDLGTNTILMVIGRLRTDGSVEILDDAHAIARLGQGVDAARRILPQTLDRVCAFLRSYVERALSFGAASIAAYGTSALRDAANQNQLIDRVRGEIGLELIALSGEEEARLTFTGAAFGLDLPGRYGVLDIGGGSTELAIGSAGVVEQSQSIDLGAVRLTERHFPALPPDSGQLQAARAAILQHLDQLFPYPAEIPLVGVAGTVTTLGALDRSLDRFDAQELNGHFLSLERVEALSDRLLSLSLEHICALPPVSEQRADIIGAGSLILRAFLRQNHCPGIIVSTRGLRYGLLLQALSPPLPASGPRGPRP